MKTNIESFLQYKRRVLSSRPNLIAVDRLISIDGVNASGKNTFAIYLQRQLQQRFGFENVIVADITHFTGSPKQERLKRVFKNQIGFTGNESDDKRDQLYMATLNRGYEEIIIPALGQGKIVIMPRSELSLLQYHLLKSSEDKILRCSRAIADGTINHRLHSGNKLFIKMRAEDQWKNLITRGELGLFDPRSLEEVEKRDFLPRADASLRCFSGVWQLFKFGGNFEFTCGS